MKEMDSDYFDLVQRILEGLAKVRMEEGAWLDIESENVERESQAFKIGECLRPFYLAAREFPEKSSQLPLSNEVLLKDTEKFLKFIQKDGFFPSPYSPIAEAKDQYTDFAAFVLDFCGLAYKFWNEKKGPGQRIINSCREIANKSLTFLIDPGNHLEDEQGCRWGGTNKYSRIKKRKELYTNTVFTSIALIALQRALEDPVLGLDSGRQNEVRDVIRKAGKWIVGRFDNEFITGNEEKTNRSLINSTWGLLALAESYYTQDPNIRNIVPSLTNAYLSALKTSLAKEEFLTQQEYLTIVSEDVDYPLYYEDRSGLGGILLTLISLRNLPDLERLLEELNYNLTFEQVSNSIMMLRNPRTGLWFNQGLILSIHSYLVEAYLKQSRRVSEFFRKIEVSGHMVRRAVKETLLDEAIISSLQQTVYQRLLRIVDTIHQERTVEKTMDQLIIKSSTPKGIPGKSKKEKKSG